MTRTRRSAKLLALLAGASLIAAACSSDDNSDSSSTEAPAGSIATADTEAPAGSDTTAATSDTEAPAGGEGGTVTFAWEQEYTSYNNDAADQVLVANLNILNVIQPNAFISQPDLTYKLATDLLVSAEVTSEDPEIVEYVIQPDAVWEDGDPIDCDDFYLAWIAHSGALSHANPDYTGPGQVDAEGAEVPETLSDFNPASTTGYENIESLECSDDLKTVTTTYSSPFADWQSLFDPILPAHVVERESGVADITAIDPVTSSADSVAVGEFWNTGFVGFDPAISLSGSWYRIDQWNQGQNLIVKRNENYYGTPAILDEIVFLLVPDATQQPAALENGDAQLITPQPNADLVAQLDGIEGVTVELDQGVTWEHYDFNQANPLLADLAVRQAFSLCIDREEIVDTLVRTINPDATVLNNHIYVPGSPDYADNSGGLTRDVDAAKALLDGAGYTLGDDGVYADADGNRLSFRLGRRDPNPRRQSTNELTIEQCAEAGIELTDDPSEDFNVVRLPASDYDIALFAWQSTAALSSGTSIYIPGGGQNWNSYVNEDVATLFEQANSEFDPAVRADLMNQIDQTLWDDAMSLPLFQFQDLVAYSSNLTNVVYNGPLGITWNANEWSLAG